MGSTGIESDKPPHGTRTSKEAERSFKMRKRTAVVAGVLAAFLAAGSARGARAAQDYRVAVLDFDASKAKDSAVREWGAQVADLLTALLSAEPGLELVERASLERAVREHKLNLTGLVGEEDRVKLGRLVGAQFLVIGRLFPIDRNVCLVAKLVSVETSRMTAEVVQGPMAGELAPLVKKLAGKLAGSLRRKAAVLLPKPREAPDVVADVRKALGRGGLPKVLVSVTESHVARRASGAADPAAATELVFVLKSCGFEVSEEASAKRIVADWARRFLADTGAELPSLLAGVDVVLVGQGFSEFGARTGDLVTCLARLEVQAVDTRTTRVLAIGRKTARAVDLAEGIAAKTALQKAASSIAAKLIPDAVRAWREAHPDLERARRATPPADEKDDAAEGKGEAE